MPYRHMDPFYWCRCLGCITAENEPAASPARLLVLCLSNSHLLKLAAALRIRYLAMLASQIHMQITKKCLHRHLHEPHNYRSLLEWQWRCQLADWMGKLLIIIVHGHMIFAFDAHNLDTNCYAKACLHTNTYAHRKCHLADLPPAILAALRNSL